MSVSAVQASAFYDEALRFREVWTVRDDGAIPAPFGGSGKRSMPFWSQRSRVEHIIKNVPAFADFRPERIQIDEWREAWLPDLGRGGLMVGLNWSGPKATGYDLPPGDVERALRVREQAPEPGAPIN